MEESNTTDPHLFCSCHSWGERCWFFSSVIPNSRCAGWKALCCYYYRTHCSLSKLLEEAQEFYLALGAKYIHSLLHFNSFTLTIQFTPLFNNSTTVQFIPAQFCREIRTEAIEISCVWWSLMWPTKLLENWTAPHDHESFSLLWSGIRILPYTWHRLRVDTYEVLSHKCRLSLSLISLVNKVSTNHLIL